MKATRGGVQGRKGRKIEYTRRGKTAVRMGKYRVGNITLWLVKRNCAERISYESSKKL
jgi:hypothetical protein